VTILVRSGNVVKLAAHGISRIGEPKIGQMEPAEYRRTSLEAWRAAASGWESWRAQLAEDLSPVRRWLVTKLAPRPGDTVLELSAGPGDTGFAAAEIVGEQGRLLSTDFSPEMVEVARRRGAELGLRNVDYRVTDAEHIDLDADSVDGVLCQSGYMLIADPAAALSETRRVLRPGGRVALSVWGAPDRNPWAGTVGRFLVERGHIPPPDPGAPGVFSMASEERTRELLEGAGFTAVRIEEVAMQWTFGDLDEYQRWVTDVAAALAVLLRGLSAEESEALTSHLEEAFAAFASDGGYKVPGLALCAVAT
jgi:SAM-dependent methyltransferase